MIRYLCIILLTLCFTPLFAQQDTGQVQVVDYSVPRSYTIGGITVSGTKFLDPNILISLSGLYVGQEIDIPGEDIPKAIKTLWRQGLFTNVEVYITKFVGANVFLDIKLQERPRMSRFVIKGVRKSEIDDIRDAINLVPGRVVTENVKLLTELSIRNYYEEKGFLNAQVNIAEIKDSILPNSVLLSININKGAKVKIAKVNIYNNPSTSDRKVRKLMKNTKERARFSLRELFNFKDYRDDSTRSINPIEILGNLSPSKVFEYVDERINLNVFAGSKYLPEEYENDLDNVVAYYNTLGYRDAKIERDTVFMREDGHLQVDVTINEGQRYYFRDITWTGNTKYTDEQLDLVLNIQKGEVYNQELLDTRLYMNPTGSDVSSIYMDDGYLFFQITPTELRVEEDSIDLEIRIYEGPQAVINKIIITGNTKTNEHVIRRELRTIPGNKFSRSDLIRSQREIANLGYFDPEQINVIPYPNPENGTVDIEYQVVEKPSDQLELSAGWGGRGRGIVGTVGISFTNFSLRNMFSKGSWSPLPSGDGQQLSLRIQSNGRVYQSYNVSFTEPWLGGNKPNSFTVSFFRTRFARLNTDNDVVGSLITNGTTIGFGTRLKWPDDFFTFQTALNFQNFLLDEYSTADFIIDNGVSNNLSLRFTLARNSVDAPLFPRRGSNISLSLQLTPPYSAFNNKDYTQLNTEEKFRWVEYHKWRFNAEWFTPIVGDLILRTSMKFGFLGFYNKDIGLSPFERFELGGDGIANFNFVGKDILALRGYEVLTPSEGAAIFNKFTVELRYPLSLNPSATVYALAFVEGGNWWNSFKDYNPFDLNRSAGLGVRVFLPMFGLLGFDYGIGFDKNVGETQGFGDYLNNYGKFSIILGFEPE